MFNIPRCIVGQIPLHCQKKTNNFQLKWHSSQITSSKFINMKINAEYSKIKRHGWSPYLIYWGVCTWQMISRLLWQLHNSMFWVLHVNSAFDNPYRKRSHLILFFFPPTTRALSKQVQIIFLLLFVFLDNIFISIS